MNPSYDSETRSPSSPAPAAAWDSTPPRAFAAVALADVNEGAVRAATDELSAAGHQALGVTCDVSDETQVAALVDRTVDAFGRLDMAFNNAGLMPPVADAADEPAEAYDRVTAINLRGVWACMKHELRQMRAQGSGAIVNCSSLGGLVGNPGRASYHATKHGYWAPDGDLVFYCDSDAPYFGGIVRIGEFDGDMEAIARQGEDFSATIERAE